MKISVYNAISLDGFIARLDGSLDWLEGSSGDEEPEALDSPGRDANSDDYGFFEFLGLIDTMVMGRGTYEFVAAGGEWPYEGKRTIVLSSTLGADDVASHLAGKIEFLAIEPVALIEKLASEGAKHVYVDGGITIQRFLRAGLIDELILTRVPVLLGSGIPLFDDLDGDVHLKHVETRSFASGMVQSKYWIG